MSVHHARLNRRALDRWARAVKVRAGYRCEGCGRAGRLEADHVIPLERGGAAYDLANGQALCVACHISKNRRESRQRKQDAMTPAQVAWAALVAELQGVGGSA